MKSSPKNEIFTIGPPKRQYNNVPTAPEPKVQNMAILGLRLISYGKGRHCGAIAYSMRTVPEYFSNGPKRIADLFSNTKMGVESLAAIIALRVNRGANGVLGRPRKRYA